MADLSTLRQATIKDLPQLAHVKQACANTSSFEEALASMEREIQKGYNFIVAERDGKVVGMFSWRMHGRPKHGLVELEHMDVHPDYQRRGIGSELVANTIVEAQKFYQQQQSRVRKLFVFVSAENDIAQNFFQKQGFTHEATLKDHYYVGRDELMMSKFIK